MKLSQGEKLILLALASAQDGREPINLNFIRSAILSGNTWALSWEFQGIPREDTTNIVAEETAEIMAMWSYIERSVAKLPEPDRKRLEKDAYPFDLAFEGFDGNHDHHHGVASFLVENMDRFSEFKGRGLNSHSQSSLPHYRRMLPVYRDVLRDSGLRSRELSADDILKIVKTGWPEE